MLHAFSVFSRLEDYDRNDNFGRVDNDGRPEFNMVLPDKSTYKDIHSECNMPKLKKTVIDNYLLQFDARFSQPAKRLYNNKFLLFARHSHHNSLHFIHAKCKAQMKTPVQYLIDISLTEQGCIHQCQCECGAGEFIYSFH